MFEIPRAQVVVPTMNTWETRAMAHNFPRDTSPVPADAARPKSRPPPPRQDPIIYPGLYAPSGIDVMTVLFRVFARPNPQFELGPVDCSVALTVCNLDVPGCPIIYANDAFACLTGYTANEIMGRNPSFLQSPGGLRNEGNPMDQQNEATQQLDKAIATRNEIQLCATNFKKNGQRFTNMMSMIPIQLPGDDTHYAVGFHVDID